MRVLFPHTSKTVPQVALQERYGADCECPSFVKTCIMAALFVFWTVCILPVGLVFVLLMSPLSLMGFRPVWMQTAARRYVSLYGRGMLFLLRPWMPVYVKNAQALMRTGPCVLVVNHQSFLDLYLLGSQAQGNLCLVSKSWPYKKLFFFAPVMRFAGYVDAESLPAEEVARLCVQRLAEGASVVFFPEGTRSKDGSLQKFHTGAFLLAQQAGVPVVPMIIYNAWRVFPKGAKLFAPQAINMELLEPVFPQHFYKETLPHRAMMRHVRALFATHMQS